MQTSQVREKAVLILVIWDPKFLANYYFFIPWDRESAEIPKVRCSNYILHQGGQLKTERTRIFNITHTNWLPEIIQSQTFQGLGGYVGRGAQSWVLEFPLAQRVKEQTLSLLWVSSPVGLQFDPVSGPPKKNNQKKKKKKKKKSWELIPASSFVDGWVSQTDVCSFSL